MAKEPAAKEAPKETKDQKLKVYEQNAKLCRAVQAQPCIYDRSVSQQNKDLHKAWTAVATACEDTVPSCKVRWQNIRYAFMRSLLPTKNRPSNRTRNYYLHDVLQFFIPHMVVDNSSGTEDEMETLELEKTESPQKATISKSPVKQSDNLDEEPTTSVVDTIKDEQASPTSSKKKLNRLIIKKQANKFGTFEIKKNEQTQDSTKTNIEVDDDDVQIIENTETIKTEEQAQKNVTLEVKPEKNTVKEASPEEAEAAVDGRKFRFRRACKRSMDKSMVQQLRSSSAKREAEPKRTRRSLSARRATHKPDVTTTPKAMETTPLKVLEVTKASKEILEAKIQEKTNEKKLENNPPKPDIIPDQTLKNTASFIPSGNVDMQMKSRAAPEQPVVIEWASTPTSIPFIADGNKSCVPFVLPASLLKFDRAVQCDKDLQRSACDDEFLDMLRPQMAAMNARQKLYFKQKIYKSLIEVFDDASNFPQSDEVPSASAFPVSPFPGVSSTTGAEMVLIRELVSLVQAAKLTPELTKTQNMGQNTGQSDKVATGSGKITPAPTHEAAKTPNESATTQTHSPPITTPPPVETSKKYIYRSYPAAKEHDMDESMQRQLMRKVVKVSSLVNTPEGEKRRIYRILPKSCGAATSTTHTPSSGSVGTFIIPRAPGSIASSVNAAAAAAAAANSSNVGSQDNAYRQIPVSGGTVYVSGSGATGANSTSSAARRLMTIRSTVRPSGTCVVPRQIVRRYSICGSGNMSAMDNIRSTKIITTTINTPPHEVRSSFSSNPSNAPNVRYVRATATATPPFKQLQLPTATTTVTQTLTTRTTASTQLLKQHSLPDKTASTQSLSRAADTQNNLTFNLTGFNSIFSSSSSSSSSTSSPPIASTAIGKNATKTTTLPHRAARTNDKKSEGLQIGNQNTNNTVFPPNDKHADTAAIIASDYFGSFNIKNEPLD